MKCSSKFLLPSLVLGLANAAMAQQPAQQPAPPQPDTTGRPGVGQLAPDFVFRAITQDGLSEKPARLSDYRGQTVVLWFFVKARTRG